MRITDGILRIRINDLGQITGYALDANGWTQHACVWQAGQLTMLPELAGGSIACGINNLGQIVGTASTNGGSVAVLWESVPGPSSVLALLSGLGGLRLAVRRSWLRG